jgi:hypothetical protein
MNLVKKLKTNIMFIHLMRYKILYSTWYCMHVAKPKIEFYSNTLNQVQKLV